MLSRRKIPKECFQGLEALASRVPAWCAEGFSVEIAAFAPDGPGGAEFRVHLQREAWDKVLGRSGKSLADAADDAGRWYDTEVAARPAVTGLPASQAEWDEALAAYSALARSAVKLEASVTLLILLSDSRRRRWHAEGVPAGRTAYALEVTEPLGGSTTEWVKAESETLSGAVADAAARLAEALPRMAEQADKNDALWRR